MGGSVVAADRSFTDYIKDRFFNAIYKGKRLVVHT